jgi:hypothetical protein
MTAALKDFEKLVPESLPGSSRYTPVNQRRILCVFPRYPIVWDL